MRMIDGLFWAELSSSHELRNDGVVAGESLQSPITHEVRAGIANMANDRDVGLRHENGDNGCAHATQLVVLIGPLVNCRTCRFAGLDEQLRRVFLAVPAMDDVGDDLAAHVRRCGAAPVTTHAVQYDVETKVGIDVDAVLILFAQESGVG
jgi:hypothetical protein